MKDLKQFTIKTANGTQKFICYDIDNFLAATCFCDAYEVIKEVKTPVLAEKFKEYYSMIPQNQFVFPGAAEFWENNIFLLLSGYYETFEEMMEENKI